MSTKIGPIQGRCSRTGVLLMMTPLLLLNASQAMTLCVRGDGQVALELLVQGHCICDVSTPGAETSESLAGTASHGAGDGGQPCMDIPIPTSTCESRTSSAADSQPPCLSGCDNPEMAMTQPSCATTHGSSTVPTYPAPLATILLQV